MSSQPLNVRDWGTGSEGKGKAHSRLGSLIRGGHCWSNSSERLPRKSTELACLLEYVYKYMYTSAHLVRI